MGKSKSSVGIKIVDDFVDSTINKGTNAAAKNAERSLQNVSKSSSLLFNGKFNNLDRTLFDAAVFGSGIGAIANPDDLDRIYGKQTITQRMESEAAQAQAYKADEDVRAREAMAVDGVRSTISGQIGARMRTPGRGMTLLSGGGGRANTLLTVTGG